MMPSRLSFVVAVVFSVFILGHADLTTQKPVTITVHPKTTISTTPVPTSTTSTQAPDTTTSSTTTQAPNTTTSTTTTTTPTPDTTTSTTPKPTPAPTPKPTPPPAPKPLPPPMQGNWSYSEKNVTCIVLQFAAQLNVTYTKNVANDSTALGYKMFNLPPNATVTGGNCTGEDQWLQLSWLASADTAEPTTTQNSMLLVFHGNSTTKTYALKSLNVTLDSQMFPNASSNAPLKFYHGAGWQTPMSTSYRCLPATQLNLTSESASDVATLTISKLQEEAFRSVNGTGFSAARDCGGGDLPDAVPIAVGCALGGLVVVVLVAYLVARRWNNTRGYLSM